MNKNRIIDIKFNKFPKTPLIKKLSVNGKFLSYISDIKINLDKLARMYYIEEFNCYKSLYDYQDFPALRFLKRNTNYFTFQLSQPGSSKDSRKEQSRVIGQTICRYFLYYRLNKTYISHIGTYIGKQLHNSFGNTKIERIKKGDTPDFIAATSPSDICIAEAKGSRKIINFSDKKFKLWRKQFKTIKISQNHLPIKLKGYISLIVIANERNKIKKSQLLIEDPATIGKEKDENLDLFNLIKCGHYCELLGKIGLDFIGDSLLSINKISENEYFEFNTFTLKVDTDSPAFDTYVGVLFQDQPSLKSRIFLTWLDINKYQTKWFWGLKLTTFKSLLEVARGNFNNINDIKESKDYKFNNSIYLFRDNSVICNSNLVSFSERIKI